MSKAIQILKKPIVSFLLIGASIFALYSVSQTSSEAALDSSIVLDSPTLEWIHANFTKQFRRPPTRHEMDRLIDAHIVSEVKYRHALQMGLDDQDSIIRRRMMQKFDFLFGNAAADAIPDDTILEDWYHENSEDFLEPATITFTHLYFSPDKRKSASTDATNTLAALQKKEKPESDNFPFQVVFENATFPEVRNVLGPEFAQTVFTIPIGTWQGPIQSGLGVHLVNISDITRGQTPPFEKVRDGVLQQWREQESDNILLTLVSELRDQIDVTIDSDAITKFEYSEDSTENVQ